MKWSAKTLGNVSRPDLHFSGQQELDLPIEPNTLCEEKGCLAAHRGQPSHLPALFYFPHCCQRWLMVFLETNDACEQPPSIPLLPVSCRDVRIWAPIHGAQP